MLDIASFIRDVHDFPKPGIVFKDITPLLKSPEALALTVERIAGAAREKNVDVVAGIESRGFIFGAAVALELDVGFVPIRKPGKLPWETVSESYELEYGTDTIEMHTDAVSPGNRVFLVDDLLATGGTMAAAVNLVEKVGGEVAAIAFVVELAFLDGRKKLGDHEFVSLVTY